MLITSVTLSINFLFVGAGIRVYPSLQLIQIGHFQIKVRLMLFCIRWVPSYIPLDPILVTSESSLCPESFIFIIFSRLFGLHDLQLAIRQFYFNFYFIFNGKNKIKNKGSSLCFCCTWQTFFLPVAGKRMVRGYRGLFIQISSLSLLFLSITVGLMVWKGV